MKAILCTGYGPPEVLQPGQWPTPAPKGDQVRIRIHATAVTASDVMIRGLKFPKRYQLLVRAIFGWRAPRNPVLGMVLAGEIDALGPKARGFQVGDRVFGMSQRTFGTYAQYICWSPKKSLFARCPANLSFEQAAALPYGGLIARFFIRRAGVQIGQRVLVYGASGAIGTAAVQLLSHLGARVTGVCSHGNLALVESLGATNVIDYAREDFSAGDARYDLIFDAVGKRKSASAFVSATRVLAPGGKRLSVDDAYPKPVLADLVELADLAEAEALWPVIDRTYDMDDIAAAHRYVDGGHKKGNVVIRIAP